MAKFKPIKIEGAAAISSALKKVAVTTEHNVRPALVEVVTFVQKESMKRTPIDTSTLQASHRSKVQGTGRNAVGMVWLLASYALFVHEARKSVNFKSPWPRGRKFLERAIVDNIREIKALIHTRIRK